MDRLHLLLVWFKWHRTDDPGKTKTRSYVAYYTCVQTATDSVQATSDYAKIRVGRLWRKRYYTNRSIRQTVKRSEPVNKTPSAGRKQEWTFFAFTVYVPFVSANFTFNVLTSPNTVHVFYNSQQFQFKFPCSFINHSSSTTATGPQMSEDWLPYFPS